ncbi:MAG: response regulator [Proteobacteria bacterium]|nr:response regulator [Pseudomonadota bacterium]
MAHPLEKLRRTYRERLVMQVEALKGVRESFVEGGVRSDAAERSIRRLAHRLRGSGGTLGFPRVSVAAARTEEASRDALSTELDGLLDEIRRAIRDQSGARSRGAALVVDADPAVASVLQLSLAPYSDEVLIARSLQAARDILRSRPVSIIVVDLGLPDGDARDLISTSGADASLAAVPLVVLSGSMDENERQECLALGATEVHAKPVDPVAFAASARALLGFDGRAESGQTGDSETGLPGPGSLYQAALAARRQNARDGSSWAVGFLKCPDAFGLMAEVADVLRDFVPPGASLVRWDERTFGVLAGECDGEQLRKLLSDALPRCRSAAARAEASGWFAGGVMQAATAHPNHVFRMAKRMVELARMAGGDQVVSSVVGEAKKRARVLLAEDDPTFAEAITMILDEQLDLEVHHVPAGDAAIALAREAAFDLFVLDIDMPGADGLTVLRYLRGNPRYSKTPVVMVSALASDRQMVEGLESGANDYVVKPFSAAVLAARLKRLLP